MQKSKVKKKSLFVQLLYFFPLQLLFVHLKKNQQLLIFWLILFLAIYGQIGVKYGIPYLFLAPEYLGKLTFSSYLIVGFAFGGFVIAFNIASYIMNGFRFPFLATLSKPFLKYSINNSFIPLLFMISYIILAYNFLEKNEAFSQTEVFYRLLGFIVGYLTFVILSMSYFMATNQSFESLFGKELSKILKADDEKDKPTSILHNKKENSWYNKSGNQKLWRIETYLSSTFKVKYTRSFEHYDEQMLSQVFRQNHLNASRFEIVVILSIIILGLFRENELFVIPAGASIILLFTMLLMITSAIRSWIRGWTFPLIVGVLILVNQLSKYNNFYYENRAYGIDYSEKVSYPEKEEHYDWEQINKDKLKTYEMLQNWSNKNKVGNKKPKAIFFAASGGGARAALWSFIALQHLDSLTQGKLMEQTIMGTGSSGGMIGSSYFRELRWRADSGSLNPYSKKYQKDMGKDMLNPIIFNLTVNDALIRTQRFSYEGQMHWKDRGYVFEKTLLKNTRGYLDKKLSDYAEAEKQALIPSLIFSPSIVNDGRRLLISTLPLSFITENKQKGVSENIDYLSYFKDNDPLDVRFSSVLRMNSSFPYITPTVSLPTNPSIEVFDSGLRDNYGIKTLLNYIFHIKGWLEKNTSGIIIIQIRDGLKNSSTLNRNKKQSIVNEILSPFGSLYGNWFEVQDYNNDELLSYTSEWYSGEVDLINYQLNKGPDNYISLSWHLTAKEKEQIINSLNLTENKEAEKQLLTLLKLNHYE